MISVSVFLKRAKALISTESKWCQKTYARNDKGQSRPYEYNTAVAFCIEGALYRTSFGMADGELFVLDSTDYLAAAISPTSTPDDLSAFNDTKTYADVISLYDKAIELALKDQSDNEVDEPIISPKFVTEKIEEPEEDEEEPVKKVVVPTERVKRAYNKKPKPEATVLPIEPQKPVEVVLDNPVSIPAVVVPVAGPLASFFV